MTFLNIYYLYRFLPNKNHLCWDGRNWPPLTPKMAVSAPAHGHTLSSGSLLPCNRRRHALPPFVYRLLVPPPLWTARGGGSLPQLFGHCRICFFFFLPLRARAVKRVTRSLRPPRTLYIPMTKDSAGTLRQILIPRYRAKFIFED